MKSKKLFDAIGYIDERYLDMVDAPEKENMDMNKEQKHPIVRKSFTFLIAAAICVSVLAMTAYALDIGGIHRIIQIWRFGDQTTAVLDVQDGQYMLTGEDGSFLRSCGGISFEPDGSERLLTEDEIVEHLNQPDLWYCDDGSIWLYYREQEIEITDDMFDAEEVCYLELRDGDDVLYATIKRNGGMATSPLDYVQPEEFGTSLKINN